jgi:outer membrane protein assembly factor BamB
MAIDGPTGRPLWQKDNGGAGRVGNASDRIVVSDPSGTVWAIDKASGGALWSQPVLARRSLTGVAVQGDYAVVADYDGYVHWLRLDTGAIAARARVGGDEVKAAPVVADGVLLVQNIDGEVTAFRLQ